ncbi:MAG: hypothetical protein CBD65_02295 [Synechococcus sp. TMED205]|nr:MAG: hypothetical protein CBD65_02295 [Synechococcus sp. TMED205]
MIKTSSTDQHVTTGSTVNDVISTVSEHKIAISTAFDQIISFTAMHSVFPRFSLDVIDSSFSVDQIAPFAS